MHAYGKELQSYKEQTINTMTPGEMLILLYDEIIKRLKKADILVQHGDYGNFEKEMKRARDIVHYLNAVLDRKYEVSKNLAQLYNFFNYQMARIVASRNTTQIAELIPLIEDLRDTYKEADKRSKQHV